MIEHSVELVVNERPTAVKVRTGDTLLHTLREELGLKSVRGTCGIGICGTCTVLVDGAPTSACLMYAVQAEGHEVTTLHGLSDPTGELHPLQKCFLERGGAQCGFCTPGILLTAAALAERNPNASREDIRYELVGNLCRCTGYTAIIDSVEAWMCGEHSEEVTGQDGHAAPPGEQDAVEAGA